MLVIGVCSLYFTFLPRSVTWILKPCLYGHVYIHKLNVSIINFQKLSPVINIGEQWNYVHLDSWILMRCPACNLIRKLSKVMVGLANSIRIRLDLLECSSMMVAHNYYDLLLALMEGKARTAWFVISIIKRLWIHEENGQQLTFSRLKFFYDRVCEWRTIS